MNELNGTESEYFGKDSCDSDELNYRKGYLYFFNVTTDMKTRLYERQQTSSSISIDDVILELDEIQRRAESICIGDIMPEDANVNVDVGAVITYLVGRVKLNANI